MSFPGYLSAYVLVDTIGDVMQAVLAMYPQVVNDRNNSFVTYYIAEDTFEGGRAIAIGWDDTSQGFDDWHLTCYIVRDLPAQKQIRARDIINAPGFQVQGIYNDQVYPAPFVTIADLRAQWNLWVVGAQAFLLNNLSGLSSDTPVTREWTQGSNPQWYTFHSMFTAIDFTDIVVAQSWLTVLNASANLSNRIEVAHLSPATGQGATSVSPDMGGVVTAINSLALSEVDLNVNNGDAIFSVRGGLRVT